MIRKKVTIDSTRFEKTQVVQKEATLRPNIPVTELGRCIGEKLFRYRIRVIFTGLTTWNATDGGNPLWSSQNPNPGKLRCFLSPLQVGIRLCFYYRAW